MKCYNCKAKIRGTRLQCPDCGADLTLYRKIVCTSNEYYNRALSRAKVRNLTGALDLLEQSIQLNSDNYQARNLRGLILYEMGEIAEAAAEWTISAEIEDDLNNAKYYLSQINTSVQDLDSDSNLIRKYNQVVEYINTDAKDMAMIQLKKIIGMRQGMIKAHLILALLYMEKKDYEKARAVLRECKRKDTGNPEAEYYLRELKKMAPRSKKREVLDDEPKQEVIIPVRMWDFGTYVTTAAYILFGCLIAVGIMYYVMIPGVKNQYNAEKQEQLNSYQADRMEYEEEIRHLQEAIQNLESARDNMSGEFSDYTENSENIINSYDELIQLLVAYGEGNVSEMLLLRNSITNNSAGTQIYQEAYNGVIDYIDNQLFNESLQAATVAREGTLAENLQPDELTALWQSAVDAYEKCQLIQPDNPEVIYYLGNAYQGVGNAEKAQACYSRIVTDFADTEYYASALQLLQAIAGVLPEENTP
ncbi:MAG: tetratricopeptide repeat protein [Lachnospiraceae bacterium]